MSVKKRITEFIDSKGISVKKFEEMCELSNGYVSSMRKSFGAEKLNNVLNVFPDLNREWLLYGEGEMLNPLNSDTDLNQSVKKEPASELKEVSSFINTIPLLPISAQGGTLNDFTMSVRNIDCEMVYSPILGADFAITVSGDSMAPEYPNGAQVLIKKVNEKAFLEWGRAYVLDTCNGVVLKILNPSERGDDFVRCISINKNPIYAPFDVCWADVYGAYRVLMCMSIK